jgi:hypothetical protein
MRKACWLIATFLAAAGVVVFRDYDTHMISRQTDFSIDALVTAMGEVEAGVPSKHDLLNNHKQSSPAMKTPLEVKEPKDTNNDVLMDHQLRSDAGQSQGTAHAGEDNWTDVGEDAEVALTLEDKNDYSLDNDASESVINTELETAQTTVPRNAAKKVRHVIIHAQFLTPFSRKKMLRPPHSIVQIVGRNLQVGLDAKQTTAMCKDHWARAVLDWSKLQRMSVYIAVLLHNNEAIIPHFDHELTRLLGMIDATASHLSI